MCTKRHPFKRWQKGWRFYYKPNVHKMPPFLVFAFSGYDEPFLHILGLKTKKAARFEPLSYIFLKPELKQVRN